MPRYYDTKTCIKCHIEKDISEFYKRTSSKDGYRNECISCGKKCSNDHYYDNIERYKDRNKKWRELNQEKLDENLKKFLDKNPDYRKNWYQSNKRSVNERNQKRRNTDTNFRLKENIRNLIKNSINYSGFKKTTKTIDILGCNNEEFRVYLESKFEPWMNWENYGVYDGYESHGWDIDHIIPLSSAKTEEEIIKLNHYSNLQPLCSYKNRVTKRARLI